MHMLMALGSLLILTHLLMQWLPTMPATLAVPGAIIFLILVLVYLAILSLRSIGSAVIGTDATSQMIGSLAADTVKTLLKVSAYLLVAPLRLVILAMRALFR